VTGSTSGVDDSVVAMNGNDPRRRGVRKVAYIMARFPKITETFVLYEMLAMEELGASVETFPLRREGRGPRHSEAVRFEERAHFGGLLSWSTVRAVARRLVSDARRLLRVYLDVLAGTWGSPKFFLGALVYFPRCVLFAERMQALGVDHVHAHFASHPALAAFVVHELTGIPYSFTAHGSDLHVDRRFLAKKVEAAAFVVAVSEYNRQLIIETCGEQARAKVVVIHCGADPAAFDGRTAPCESGAQGTRPLVIACVASFEEVKGHAFLLEACRLLEERGVAFTCHLIGGGPLRPEMERRAAAFGLAERVRFHGPLPRTQVCDVLAGADVMVLASFPTRSGRREGIPVALMEGMMMGLPVVASALSGIPELVDEGCTGFLVPPGDPWTLADRLECLAAAPVLRHDMGEAGRTKVLSQFDLPGNARLLWQQMEAASRASPFRDS
jgi:colanic acid/amylovoran biosynthesis glycosyltransferase